MAAYYNEFDPFAAAWLRALIAKGLVPAGEVDERSICDIQPDDLRGFRQCHFFAGIGGWPYALRLAGWDDAREVWTGSCPCQPLSVAGKQKGADDERHLWPAFHRLIAERRPAIVFGEQVAGALGHEWLAGVRADLEESGYACGAADMPACAVDAPHIRQRLYWCAVEHAARERRGEGRAEHEVRSGRPAATGAGRAHMDGLADASGRGCGGRPEVSQRIAQRGTAAERVGGDMADAPRFTQRESDNDLCPVSRQDTWPGFSGSGSGHAGFWSDYEWRTGADGKSRRVKSGVRLLAHGIPGRVGRLRGYGNAIVPQAAQAFVESVMGCI